MYVYPSARKSAESVILAMKHFVSNDDEVGICYSDNAPELINAMKELKWRHVLSKAYISASNAVAERSIRTVLEGTRVNLLQSGLNHGFWPCTSLVCHEQQFVCSRWNCLSMGAEIRGTITY